MNKNTKFTIKSSVQRGNEITDNIDEAVVKKVTKIDIGNESPKHSCDSRFSGHSTPIRKKDHVYDVEDSPELDYRCSPISLPCTQDGGNEIAWDWQVPVNKISKDKSKNSNALETPKRTKQLQKKRNSNSPLLQKPHKRKLLKVENIENIGKLTAELRALSEKMKSIQDFRDNTDVNESEIKCEAKSNLLVDVDSDSSDDIMVEIVTNNDTKPNIIINNNNRKHSNYEDLFDDSIEDSMVRCSQEIEEKLNLCKKGNELLAESKDKEVSSIFETETHCLTTSNSSTENSRNSSIAKHSSVSTSGYLRTYSNNSNKTNSASTMSSSKISSKNITDESDGKGMFQEKSISQIPDDSFDDCLATCIEDDKLLSKVSEYEFSPSYYSSKQIVSNASNKKTESSFLKLVPHNGGFNNYQNLKLITDELVDEIEVITDQDTIRKTLLGKNSLEKRKFFKTKSLSDQYFYQNRIASVNYKTNPLNSVASTEKRVQSNSVNSSVSTALPKGQNSNKNNNFSSINGMENARALNRLEEKEEGNCIVKYNSTSNLFNMKEMSKDSQPVPCTPAEIEKKRLEAKMKLEAKRKLKQTNSRLTNVPSKAPIIKSVKR